MSDDTKYKGGGVNALRRRFPDDLTAEVERPLWDSVAQEPARLSGTPFRLYSIRRAMNRHPLYGEPSQDRKEWDFHGPWEMYCSIEFEQGTDIEPEAETEGLTTVSTATMWLARRELEESAAPMVKVGDVIDFWGREPFDDTRWWDVTKANPDGNVFSSEVFVQYRIELKRRTHFDPKRKVEEKEI